VLIGNEQLALQVLRGGTTQPVLSLKRMSDGLDETAGEVLHSQTRLMSEQRKAG